MGEEGIGNAPRNFIGIIILHRGRWLPPFIVRGEEQICGLHWRSIFKTLGIKCICIGEVQTSILYI